MAYTRTHSGSVPFGAGTSKNLPLGFTAANNHIIAVFISSSAAYNATSGWNEQNVNLNQMETSLIWKTSNGTETTCPITQGVDRSVLYTVLEFEPGTTVSAGLAGTDTSTPTVGFTYPNITGMTASQDNTIVWTVTRPSSGSIVATANFTGAPAPTEISDHIIQSQTGVEDGLWQAVALTNTTGTTAQASFAYGSGPSGFFQAHQNYQVVGFYKTVVGNAAPTASAGSDQTVAPNAQVTLTGAGSTDSDGTIASYAWTQVSGTSVTLSGTGATRTFTPTATGTYVFGLIVTDDDGATSAQDTVTINVTEGGGSSATEYTIFGSSAPGAVQLATDGAPSIRLGGTFYQYGAGAPAGSKITGGRVYTPVGSPGTIRIMLFTHPTGVRRTQGNLDTTPARSVDVATNPGGWTEARWIGADLPATGLRWMIGYEFVGGTADDNYAYYPAPTATGPVTNATANIALSESLDDDPARGPVDRSYFRVGTGSVQSPTNLYAVDTIVSVETNAAPTANAGADQSVTTGTQVTLNGSGSTDSDGTIASYAWSQTAGTSVTLSGSGASRTFTPSAAGTYTFQLTVTDDDGATGTDSITVTASAPPTFPTTVAEENVLTGTAQSQWFQGLSSLGLPSFARSTYYTPGQTAQFSVDCTSAFTIQVFRMGHYGGNGAREVQTPIAATPTTQPAPVVIPNSNGAVTCAAWSNNASWSIPATALPGWYMAMFRRTSDSAHGFALFQVSDKNSKRPIVIVASDATWHAAYNGFGGNNVYGASEDIGSSAQRALCSTYDKPVITKDRVPQTHFFNNTYPYLKWSERMGINAAHTTIEQIKDDPTILDGRTLIVWTGHNEYIPQQVMDKTKSLLAAGQNMLNLAGNDFFWRVKYTDGTFASSTNGRVMWCKKDTLDGPTAIRTGGAGTPFTNAADWTGTWQDTRWANREPSEDFFGDRFIANGIRADEVKVPATLKGLPAWRSCPGIQALTTGQTYTFAAGTLGMEWDMPVTANTNVEQILFSESILNLTGNASDINGQNYNVTVNNARHAFSMVRKQNSYIANFNSDQWPWSLDALHLRGSAAADVNAMQMMLNVIYDLGGTAHSASVTSASLTVPTPVSSISTAYGFTAPDPTPPTPGVYYSDGTTWTAI